ncbi:phosphotransferase enzyme family protein [Marinivivus vitaminiproducens]|uniref:phosphotransferase enzyme family protein n=1 Tax=Marinivivus vitaminiproducens TaxID=3035935 RepID=UPI00279ECBA7|nr:phosphotransferase [Geminicoccaceae bacterium SCSIO 64248]
MTDVPETRHSLPAAGAVASWIEAHQDVGTVTGCVLWHRGLNDTYLIEADAGRYVLRLSRLFWRSEEEVAYEIAMLLHLGRHHDGVALPVAGKDGRFAGRLPTAEGHRIAVLFERAPGGVVQPAPRASRLLGRAAASVHRAAAGFTRQPAPFRLDLGHLLDQPLTQIRPFVRDRPDDVAFLDAFACELRGHVEAAKGSLEWGFCHGDIQFPNAHLDGDFVRLFDFDCCGEGWRSYDVAVYRWTLGSAPDAEQNWQCFLDGYRSVRALGDADIRLVPVFVALRAIWIRGLHTGNADDFGRAWLNEAYWDRFIGNLRAWRDRIRKDIEA